MERFRTNLKAWLKAIGKNREWLAEQCGVKKRTVDSWFSWGTVTEQTERHLKLLMQQYPAKETPVIEENSLVLTVDATTFDRWNVAATEEGKLLRQWAIDGLNELAGE